MECLGLYNKPKADVYPGHKLTSPKEEEEEPRRNHIQRSATARQAYEKNGKKLSSRNIKLVQQYTITIHKTETDKMRFPELPGNYARTNIKRG